MIFVSHCLTWGQNDKKELIIEEPEIEGGGEEEQGEEEEKEGEEEQENKDEESKEEKEDEIKDEDELIEEEAKEEQDGEEENEAEEEQAEEEQEPQEPVYIPWKDEDYQERIPIEKYKKLKELEDKILEAQIENVKFYIVSAGLIYGNGEDFLKNYLRAAWKQDPLALPFLSDGENLVPSIHVKDLVKFIFKIVETQPEQKYHFAFDGTQDRSLKNLIGAISRTIGSGLIESVEKTEMIQEEHLTFFTQDFWALPSKLLLPYPKEPKLAPIYEGEEEQQQEVEIEDEEEEEIDFEWYAKEGFESSGEKILKEFTERESLRPLNIYIMGGINTLKSDYCRLLAKQYNVPYLNLDELFVDLERKCKDQLYYDFLEEKEKIEQFLEDRSIRYFVNHSCESLNLDEAGKVFFRCLKWRLSQNDCKNRGYVFDDPILTGKDFEIVFNKQNSNISLIRKIKKKKTQTS